MSKIVPYPKPIEDCLLHNLEDGKVVRLDSLSNHLPFKAKVSTLVSDDGVVLGTILYVWAAKPDDLLPSGK